MERENNVEIKESNNNVEVVEETMEKIDDKEISELHAKGFHNTFTEDLVMLESQQEIIDAHEGMPTVNINADKTTMPVRRMMDNLLKEQSLNSA